MATGSARYALYYAPNPDTALWQFGSDLIGYDAETGRDRAPPQPFGSIADWSRLTDDPRRYGFHATLKAPFYLADGVDEDKLVRQVGAFARSQEPVPLGALTVSALGPFLALTGPSAPDELSAFAGRCVGAFEHLRAPLSDADRERRLKSPLTARQKIYLQQYGYPYVHEEFRFHMSLTGPLAGDRLEDIFESVSALYARSVPEVEVLLDQIAIFIQPSRDERFRVLERFPLG
jgi:putative phosphonate metabolism protein